MKTLGPNGEHSIDIADFILGAHTTAFIPPNSSPTSRCLSRRERTAGAYIALKRCAPGVCQRQRRGATKLNEDRTCKEARVYLGVLGLTANRVTAAEALLRGQEISDTTASKRPPGRDGYRSSLQPTCVDLPNTSAMSPAPWPPLPLDAASRRSRGEHVEVSHLYA